MATTDLVFLDFASAYSTRSDGHLLASTICPEPPKHDPARLYHFRQSINPFSVKTDLEYKFRYNPMLRLDKKEVDSWIGVFEPYHKFVVSLLAAEEAQNSEHDRDADWPRVYEDWKQVVNALYRGYQSNVFEAWTIPCLYVAGKYLRVFAIKADEQIASQRDSGLTFSEIDEDDAFDPSSKNEKLEDAARSINRIFGLCIGDRVMKLTVRTSNPLESSRKWALYYVATLLFKTYFKLNHISLSKNILSSLRAAATTDMPALTQFPRSHQVPFNYYCGVIHFLQEDYASAEQYLNAAYTACHARASRKNVRLILTYLIPTKLLTSHLLPSSELLDSARHPELARLFAPLVRAIRTADLTAFTAALDAGEDEFVKRRIYLTLERGRDVILRNLFRRVFLAGGFEPPRDEAGGEGGGAVRGPPPPGAVRRTRVPIKEFAAALRLAGADIGDGEGGVDYDEVECLIANTIYKNLMKGYIARERAMVVLSKVGAFPGTGV